MTPLLRKFLGMHWLLVVNMVALLVFGVFAIYSACWMRDEPGLALKWRDQVILILVGMVFFFSASLIDYKWVKYLGIPFYLTGIVLLLVTREKGDSAYGTQGWLHIAGPVSVQTSQVAIAGGIILLALILSVMHKMHPVLRNPFVRLTVTGMVTLIPFALVLEQGDFGSSLVWLPVFGVMILIGNIPFRYMIVMVLVGTMFLPFVFFFGMKEYQKKRITTQIDMLLGKKVDTKNEAYSAHNNLLAIGSGSWAGKGFKNPDTINNQGFISPATAINDFIFAVLAEEYGFRGSLMMLGGFMLLLLQSIFVAFYSRDMMGRLLVVGVVGLLFAHIYQNVGMNLLIMPITGIPLPLISYGGSFVVIIMFMLGLVQSVWVHRIDPEEKVERPSMQIDHLN